MAAPQPSPGPEATSRRIGRVLEAVLPPYAAVVFVILWVYVALVALTDSPLPADTWAWLEGLDMVPAIIVWLAILPVGVFLWAWQADLGLVFMGLVMLGLVGWTVVALSGLRRSARSRRARTSG